MTESSFPIIREDQLKLALIYVEKHATAESTPEDLCELYRKACAAIQACAKGNGSGRVG